MAKQPTAPGASAYLQGIMLRGMGEPRIAPSWHSGHDAAWQADWYRGWDSGTDPEPKKSHDPS